ncbi:hypothetical protein ACRYWZ_04825 [Agrobacterium deltaense]|uniref:hypothetical protein n=1 Tax=Agrobacterium deltaense TaxID=1183412 RepID=UPI003D97EF9D
MAAPLPLSRINDILPIASVEWDIQRNDELSGDGNGDLWQAELADPFWRANVTLGRGLHAELKRVAARIRALEGAKQSFLLVDPLSPFPAADPDGAIVAGANVTIRGTVNRYVAQVSGLPANYVLTEGDKMQIVYGTQEAPRYAFVEVSQDVIGTLGGIADISVFPRLPMSLVIGAAVTLARPACAMIIQPTTHKPGTARRSVTDGAGFTALQKKRG